MTTFGRVWGRSPSPHSVSRDQGSTGHPLGNPGLAHPGWKPLQDHSSVRSFGGNRGTERGRRSAEVTDVRARRLPSGWPLGDLAEPGAGTHRACAVTGPGTDQVAPNVTLHRPCAQVGGGAAGGRRSSRTSESRRMRTFHSERGSSPLLLGAHGCVI